MPKPYEILAPGGFNADQVPSGSPYELVNGHPVVCLPTGRRGSVANLDGGMVITTDPAVKRAGVDLGVSPLKHHLRAPDVAVLADDEPDAPGWAKAAPPLAVEYADTGQDEGELNARIAELLAAGTRFIWVVRLEGIRRVEVHTPDGPPLLYTLGQQLTAPGVLQNPVPVEALFFHDAAQQVALRNLLQREGYADLEDVLARGREQGIREGKAEGMAEGKAEGLRAGLRAILSLRGLPLTEAHQATLDQADAPTLTRWLLDAGIAASVDDLLT
ncbi:MAG: Uma2 family endonuclease [Alphaproteobacteria bacterium]|nr:Uma2 family endonuclease [Alphaproteobacteria bacterium]